MYTIEIVVLKSFITAITIMRRFFLIDELVSQAQFAELPPCESYFLFYIWKEGSFTKRMEYPVINLIALSMNVYMV